MKPYQSWEFCKENCPMFECWPDKEERMYMFCGGCKAYKLHQYLKEHQQILEEGSKVAHKITDANYFEKELEDTRQVINKSIPEFSHLLWDVPLDVSMSDICTHIQEIEAALEIYDEVINSVEKIAKNPDNRKAMTQLQQCSLLDSIYKVIQRVSKVNVFEEG